MKENDKKMRKRDQIAASIHLVKLFIPNQTPLGTHNLLVNDPDPKVILKPKMERRRERDK